MVGRQQLFTREELSEQLELIHALVGCRDLDHLRRLARRFAKLAGADGMIIGRPQPTAEGETVVADLNISYPDQWVAFYQTREFWRIDPVVKDALSREGPRHWDDSYQRFPPPDEFLQRAADFGMRNGCTHLTRSISGEHWTLISLSGDFCRRREHTHHLLQRLSPHFHLALLNLRAQAVLNKLTTLSRREREVLKWLQQGKSTWDISGILKVSEAAVHFHVKNLKKKLNVVSRHQAIAYAIHADLADW